MDAQRLRNFLTIALTVVFYVLFASHSLGINLMIFSGMLVFSAYVLEPEKFRGRTLLGYSLGLGFAMGAMLWNNGLFHQLLAILALVMWLGAFKAKQEINPLKALLQGFGRYWELYHLTLLKVREALKNRRPIPNLRLIINIGLLLFGLLGLILGLFVLSSPRFSDLLWSASSWTGAQLELFTLARISFFALGFVLVRGFLLVDLGGKQKEKSKQALNALNAGQKSLWRTLLWLVNILLLIYLLVELEWWWNGIAALSEAELRQQLAYRGLYLLLGLIVPSICISLYLHRVKSSYDKVGAELRLMSQMWLIQSGLLLGTLVLRFYYYIDYWGLSYTRLAFLLLFVCCLGGIVIAFRFLQRKKQLSFFFHRFTWASYILLLSFALVNWDAVMVRYNLNVKARQVVEPYYLLGLSDQVLPGLLEHRAISAFPEQYYRHLSERVIRFQQKQQQQTLFSWNMASYRVGRYMHHYGYQNILTRLHYRAKEAEKRIKKEVKSIYSTSQ